MPLEPVLPEPIHVEADAASAGTPTPDSSRPDMAFLDELPLLICCFLADGTLTYVNRAYCQYFSRPSELLIGTSFAPLIPEEDRKLVIPQFATLGPERPTITIEHRVIAPNGEIRWQRWINHVLVREGRVVEYRAIGEDVTEARDAAEKLRRSEVRQAEQLLNRQLEELSLLHAVALACAEATDEDELIAHVSRLFRAAFYPDNFGVLLLDESRGGLRHHSSFHQQHVDKAIHDRVILLGEGITGRVAQSGQPRRVQDVAVEPEYLSLDPGMRSELCVPLLAGRQVLGVIDAENRATNAFTEADERLLTTLAGQLAMTIDRLRLLRPRAAQSGESWWLGQRERGPLGDWAGA